MKEKFLESAKKNNLVGRRGRSAAVAVVAYDEIFYSAR